MATDYRDVPCDDGHLFCSEAATSRGLKRHSLSAVRLSVCRAAIWRAFKPDGGSLYQAYKQRNR